MSARRRSTVARDRPAGQVSPQLQQAVAIEVFGKTPLLTVAGLFKEVQDRHHACLIGLGRFLSAAFASIFKKIVQQLARCEFGLDRPPELSMATLARRDK